MIATGGCGKVYSYTSNPDIATGDGLAMAYRAGAHLANLEFVQFHPTCLYHPEAKSFLISEAVRGEGAYLINERGERFMPRYHELAELAPRDVVARSIDQELKISGDPCVFLDLRHLDRATVEARFPHLAATCRQFGIDFAGQPVPVVPAAHYMCGGVVVDQYARTSLAGLYAVGEAACTGVHGANRLASNSLLEAVYLAEAAAEAAAGEPAARRSAPLSDPLLRTGPEPAVMVLEHDWDSVRRVMWDYVGIVRDDARLDIALSRLRNIRRTVERQYASCQVTPALVELRNLALLGELIVLCARGRRESRGLHFTARPPGQGRRARRATRSSASTVPSGARLPGRCRSPGRCSHDRPAAPLVRGRVRRALPAAVRAPRRGRGATLPRSAAGAGAVRRRARARPGLRPRPSPGACWPSGACARSGSTSRRTCWPSRAPRRPARRSCAGTCAPSRSWRGSCTAVLSLFTAFGYFGSAAADACVAAEVGRVLRPGGHWYLDFLNSRRVAAELAPGPRTADREQGPLRVRETRRAGRRPAPRRQGGLARAIARARATRRRPGACRRRGSATRRK